MLFNSLIFICIFLPVVLLIYYVLPIKLKNIFLMLASLFFYIWGGSKFVFLLLFMASVDYVLGVLIDKYVKFSKFFLLCGVICSLSILGYYKYMNFILINVNKYLGGQFQINGILLPIGISFYTFQGASYLIDVYRYANKKYEGSDSLSGCKVQKNPLKLLLYISLFPQLIAGPIIRYKDISEQINARKHSIEKVSKGMETFICGLAKKVVIADTMAVIADKIFALEPGHLAPGIAWIGAVSYTLQIYFDFSGYSDMAIGLGKLFGFDFTGNFNYPYISRSITEFWRRWHISLSSWFRDYVYIPLGGSKKGNVYIHLLIVFLLTGFWHGASWEFIAWGIWYAIFIIMERWIKNSKMKLPKIPSCVRWLYTMLVVVLGWVLFRAGSLHDALTYFKGMFGISELEFQPFSWRYYLDNKAIFIMVVAVLLSVLPAQKGIDFLRHRKAGEWVVKLLSILLFLICLIMIVNSLYSPFIYFRF